MALTSSQIASKLFKKSLGAGETIVTRQFFEEPKLGRELVLSDQLWSQSGLIPVTAPVLAPSASVGVVQYFQLETLTHVSGSGNLSYFSVNLIDSIPFNFGDGTYNYQLFKNDGVTSIAFGDGDWIVDNTSGLLTFYGTLPSGVTSLLPPKISFYKYIGLKGVNVQVGNGLSIVSDTIYIGGTLSQTTDIHGDGQDLNIEGLSNLSFTASQTLQLKSIDGSGSDKYVEISNSSVLVYSGDVSDYSSLTVGDSGAFLYNIVGGGTNSYVAAEINQVYLETSTGLSSSYFRIPINSESISDGSTNNNMIIRDELSAKGLVYLDDYSSNFTVNSLVTKGYVDSIVGSVGATNGLSEISTGVIGLGGTLSQDTTINVNDFNFTIDGADNIILSSSTFDVIADGLISLDAGTGSVQILGDDSIDLLSIGGDIALSSAYDLLVTASSSLVTITDGLGLKYSSDYSGTFVTNSLITKKYVDDAVSVINADFITGITAGNGLSGGGTSGFVTLDVNLGVNLGLTFSSDNLIADVDNSTVVIDSNGKISVGNIDLNKITGTGILNLTTATVSFSSGSVLTTLDSNISNGLDVVNKNYVDAVASGLDAKIPVRVVSSTSSLSLTGVGYTIDGFTISSGDRVLVACQDGLNVATNSNGIYVADSGAWSRASDADGTPLNEVSHGNFVFVTNGQIYEHTGWVLTSTDAVNPDEILVGTNSQMWVQFSEQANIRSGQGLYFFGQSLNVGAGVGITVSDDSVGISNTTVVSGNYGTAGSVSTFTVNPQGQLTGATSVSININSGQINDFSTAVESVIFDGVNFVDGSTIDFTVLGATGLTSEVMIASLTASRFNSINSPVQGYVLGYTASGQFYWYDPTLIGDITEVIAGDGLIGGGGNGAVTLNVLTGLGITISSDAIILSDTTVSSGNYGTAGSVSTFTVNAQGQLVGATSVSIDINSSQINDFLTSVENVVFTDSNFTDGVTVTFSVTSGDSVTAEVVDGSLTASKVNSVNSPVQGYVLGYTASGQFYWYDPTLTGDITDVIAGSGLTGGGNSGAVELTVNVENGLEIVNDYVALGGTISRLTTIDGNTNDLFFSNFDNLVFTSSVFDVMTDGIISLDAGIGSVQISADDQISIVSVDDISISSNKVLYLSSSSSTVSTSNLLGLVYDTDYSATFITQSLVTKGYVDSVVGSVGATNGLFEITPGVVALGGTLSQNTSINGDGTTYEMQFDSLTNFKVVNYIGVSRFNGSGNSAFEVNTGSIALTASGLNQNATIYSSATSSITGDTLNLYFTGQSLVTDASGASHGLVYATDYSSGFISESLVTKKYVDDAVSIINADFITGVTAGNGLTGGGDSGFVTLDVNVNSDSLEIDGSDNVRLKDTITGNRTFQDSVIVGGNLTVNGTVSYINTENLYVEDNIITLNATFSGSPFLDSGIEVIRGASQAAALIWDETLDLWAAGLSGSTSTIITEAGIGLSKSGKTLSIDFVSITGVGLTQNGSQISVDTNGITGTLAGAGLAANGAALDVNTTNGLSIITDSVGLGGTLSQNTVIAGDLRNLTIDNLNLFSLTASGIEIKTIDMGANNLLQVDPAIVRLEAGPISGGTSSKVAVSDSISVLSSTRLGGSYSQISITNLSNISSNDGSTNNSMVIYDQISQKGLIYESDYSTNFTTYSLITKKYVDDAVSVINADFITGVTAGSGLVGGGDTGFITLDIETTLNKGLTFSTSGISGTLEVLLTQLGGLTFSNGGIVPSVDGSTIQVNAQGQLYTVSGSSQPVYDRFTASSTSGDSQLITGVILSSTPNDYSRVQVYVNGILQRLGNGVSNLDCYFGVSPITLNNLSIGDQLYWNGNIAGFDLSTSDVVEIVYES